MTKYVRLLGAVLSAAILSQVGSLSTANAWPIPGIAHQRAYADKVTQIAPLDQLMRGGFDGTTTVAEVRRMADFGIGTLNGLDGEMIMLDGVVYHAPSNGILRIASAHEMIPFATLTRFRSERFFSTSVPIADYASLQGFLTTSMPDPYQILAIKVRGTFKTLKIRAPQKQMPPYVTLTEALKTQAVFDLTNASGTLVGFRFPSYIGTVNSAGYHFHFISDDRRIGGHVLEVATNSISASVQTIEEYNVTIAPPN